jgi:hypothetical protein
MGILAMQETMKIKGEIGIVPNSPSIADQIIIPTANTILVSNQTAIAIPVDVPFFLSIKSALNFKVLI